MGRRADMRLRGRRKHSPDDRRQAENQRRGVDIGGATTDMFSVFGGVFNRTVSANLGMIFISNVCARQRCPGSCAGSISTWMNASAEPRQKQNDPPTTIRSARSAGLEQAVAREALRLAYVQHKELPRRSRVQQQRTVGEMFQQGEAAEYRRNMQPTS